jgi:uncharacterized protein (DUF779 family)
MFDVCHLHGTYQYGPFSSYTLLMFGLAGGCPDELSPVCKPQTGTAGSAWAVTYSAAASSR